MTAEELKKRRNTLEGLAFCLSLKIVIDAGETVANHFLNNLRMEAIMTIKASEQEAGFSLMELMIVLTIMGVLSTLVIPRYGKYKVKAAHTEVKTALAAVHTAQALHLLEENQYAPDTAQDLGIQFPSDGQYKYGNSPTDAHGNVKLSAGNSAYELFAHTGKLASCSKKATDVWCLNHHKTMTNKTADLTAAKGLTPPAAGSGFCADTVAVVDGGDGC